MQAPPAPPLHGDQHCSTAGSPAQGADGDDKYSPFSNPFGERPPCRTSAGYAVRMSASDLPSPGLISLDGDADVATTPQSQPTWRLQGLSPSPLDRTQQPGLSHGGSNTMGGTCADDAGGTPVESRHTWLNEGASSTTKVIENAMFEFLPSDIVGGAPSPELSFVGGGAQQGLSPTAESWLSRGQATPTAARTDPPTAPGTERHSVHSFEIDTLSQSDGSGSGNGSPQPADDGSASPATAPAAPATSAASGALSSGTTHERLVSLNSPSAVLRKANQILRSKAAVGGSSHLPLRRKSTGVALSTPLDKGIPAVRAPHTTPATPPGVFSAAAAAAADAAEHQGGDQRSPTSNKRSPGSPSKQQQSSGTLVNSAAHVASSPPAMSPDSVVSIGSHCAISASPAGARTPGGIALVHAEGEASGECDSLSFDLTSSPHADGPQTLQDVADEPLEDFISRLTDDVTSSQARQILLAIPGEPSLADASGEEGTARRRRGGCGAGIARGAGLALLTATLVAAAAVAAVWWAPTLTPPGIYCTTDNVGPCHAMYSAYFHEGEAGVPEVAGWQRGALQVKWWLQDAWAFHVHGRTPVGVDMHLLQAALMFPDDAVDGLTPTPARDQPSEAAPDAEPFDQPAQPATQPSALAAVAPDSCEDAAAGPAPAKESAAASPVGEAPPAVEAWRPSKAPDGCPAWVELYNARTYTDCLVSQWGVSKRFGGADLMPLQHFGSADSCSVPVDVWPVCLGAGVSVRAAAMMSAAAWRRPPVAVTSAPGALLQALLSQDPAAAVVGGALVLALVAVAVAARWWAGRAAGRDVAASEDVLSGGAAGTATLAPALVGLPPCDAIAAMTARILSPVLKPPPAPRAEEDVLLSDDERPARSAPTRARPSLASARRTRAQVQAAAEAAAGEPAVAPSPARAGGRVRRSMAATPGHALATLEEHRVGDDRGLEGCALSAEPSTTTGLRTGPSRRRSAGPSSGAAEEDTAATPVRRSARATTVRRASMQ